MLSGRQNVREIIRSLIKLTITFTVLYVIRAILLSLPIISVPLENYTISSTMIGNVVLGVLMITFLIRFEREINKPLRNISSSSLVISVIVNLVYLAAIYVAYISFYPLVYEVLPDFVWVYSMILFIIAILPISRVSIAFYRSINKLTDIISRKLVKIRLGTEEKPESCALCGTVLEHDARFCKTCGAKVRVQKSTR